MKAKLFVGGVSDAITEELLRDYFSKYGTVVETYIRRDSGRTSRGGFGFVTFADAESLTRALQDEQEHSIHGQKASLMFFLLLLIHTYIYFIFIIFIFSFQEVWFFFFVWFSCFRLKSMTFWLFNKLIKKDLTRTLNCDN